MYRHGAMLLIVRECSGFISRWFSTIVEVDDARQRTGGKWRQK